MSKHEVCVCVCVHVPSLVEVNEKHNIISETGQSVRCWHGDDEGKHVIDEGIECLLMINQYKLKKKSSWCCFNLFNVCLPPLTKKVNIWLKIEMCVLPCT